MTLVVETANYNARGTVGTNFGTLRLRGIPQSEALHVVERFTFPRPRLRLGDLFGVMSAATASRE